VSFGVSAIGAVGMSYSQNVKTLDAYYERLDKGELPIARGCKLSMDDVMRRFIIQMLMCNFELSLRSLEQAYPITFGAYFAPELEQLRELAGLGLVTLDDDWISVTLKGRMLIRNICMVFDRHLREARRLQSNPQRYSNTL
jgi:oxygen-independent coproporphyrinogen-3 oxidase